MWEAWGRLPPYWYGCIPHTAEEVAANERLRARGALRSTNEYREDPAWDQSRLLKTYCVSTRHELGCKVSLNRCMRLEIHQTTRGSASRRSSEDLTVGRTTHFRSGPAEDYHKPEMSSRMDEVSRARVMPEGFLYQSRMLTRTPESICSAPCEPPTQISRVVSGGAVA
jgi:hypothetical protein